MDILEWPQEERKKNMKREVINQTQGQRAQNGAGVKLVRVLGLNTTDVYDTFLMLDAFDSENPKDYEAGAKVEIPVRISLMKSQDFFLYKKILAFFYFGHKIIQDK